MLPRRIKKTNTNEYYLTEDGIWVRNFVLNSAPVDLNYNLSASVCNLFLQNEFRNTKKKLQSFEVTSSINKAVIVSDGYGFADKQKILAQLPFKEVAIFAVNGALANWQLVGKKCPSELQRAITWYVVNNPYPECKKFLPSKHAYYPLCVASCRTSPEFVEQYKGSVVLYYPVNDVRYSGISNTADFGIDDYRNPICAAIGLAYRIGVRKLALFCCDDSFEEPRPASEQLENKLWTYPQQIVSQNIVNGNLFWLQKAGVEVVNCSSGKNLNYSTYIKPEQLVEFFKDE